MRVRQTPNLNGRTRPTSTARSGRARPASTERNGGARPASTDPKVLSAYGHPLRAHAMDLLEARVASPSEIAALLRQPLGVVAYHVGVLREAGLVELVDRRPRRGAVEHFYTAPQRPAISDREWNRMPIVERRVVIAAGLRRLGPELAAAAERGGLAREGAHVARLPLRLDDAGWRAATDELRAALARIELAAADAHARLQGSRSGAPSGVAVLMLFKGATRGGRRAAARAGERGIRRAPIDLADPRMIEAHSHPLRAEIFRVLRDREASPSDVARQLSAPVSNASYHVRQLARLGLVELIGSRENRGAIEHFYRATVRPTILADGWDRSIGDERASRAAAAILEAARDGGFDGDDIHLTRTPFPLDARAWDAVASAVTGARAAVEALAAGRNGDAPGRNGDAPGRNGDAPGPHEDVEVVTMLFERALPEPRQA